MAANHATEPGTKNPFCGLGGLLPDDPNLIDCIPCKKLLALQARLDIMVARRDELVCEMAANIAAGLIPLFGDPQVPETGLSEAERRTIRAEAVAIAGGIVEDVEAQSDEEAGGSVRSPAQAHGHDR